MTMSTKQLEEQRKKLLQRKNKLAAEEANLKIKERKARTKKLIELGGLFVTAGLDHLDKRLLYGALLTSKKALDTNKNIIDLWQTEADLCSKTSQTEPHNIILKFNAPLEQKLCKLMRDKGLRFNKFRQEWYGSVVKINELKQTLQHIPHEIVFCARLVEQ